MIPSIASIRIPSVAELESTRQRRKPRIDPVKISKKQSKREQTHEHIGGFFFHGVLYAIVTDDRPGT